METVSPTEIVDVKLLLQIIAWLVGIIVGLLVFTWVRFEKKHDASIKRFEEKQDQLISGLAMFTEEFVAIKKDTEYLKKDVGEIKSDLHEIKRKVNLI